jgi:hypothetical protein
VEPEVRKKRPELKTILIIILLIVIAGLLGWVFGSRNKSDSTSNKTTSVSNSSTAGEATPNADVKKLVTYTLPDGWKEGSCESAPNKVYIIPDGGSLDCNANPSSAIKIYIDPSGATDCQQLGNVQNVRKHICKSQYINGHKSLVALTEYPQSSTYPANTTVSSYYIDTGKGVVKVEYTYTNDNKYQRGFDDLANSVKVE